MGIINRQTKGFTIIEVVIVLALAAFIFTIVFFAVPQLQKSLRNNQRDRDLSAAFASMIEYQSGSGGTVPTNNGEVVDFSNRYFDTLNLKEPLSGTAYFVRVVDLHSTTPWMPAPSDGWPYIIMFAPGRQCEDNPNPSDAPEDRVFTKPIPTWQEYHSKIAMGLPREGGGSWICVDNSTNL